MKQRKTKLVEKQIIHLFDDISLIFSSDFVKYNMIGQEIIIEFGTNALKHI